jgi:hypothetical protein
MCEEQHSCDIGLSLSRVGTLTFRWKSIYKWSRGIELQGNLRYVVQ